MRVKSLSRVQLFETPWTAAYQAPPSMGFSSKSNGVGCHCLLQRPWFNQGQITSVNLLLAVETEVYTEAQFVNFCA